MRPRNETARAQLIGALRRQAGAKASDLATNLGVSTATLNRMLQEVSGQLVRTGRGPQTRYFLNRSLRGNSASWPIYSIDAQGQAQALGLLDLVAPMGSLLDVAAWGWPMDDEFRSGYWPGLPYPLYDMRPQGFLGRSLAQHLSRPLGVSGNPQEWDDDTVAYVLSQHATDTSGNLVVGDDALRTWLDAKRAGFDVIAPAQLAARYLELAASANAMGLAGSSAAGEFPKFTASRELAGSQTPHVIVKFSGADTSSTVQRWSDLLVCEHLALQTITQLPSVQAARSCIVQAGGRTFLEVERFDRHGSWGRSPLCSLFSLDAALIGSGTSDWVALGQVMAQRKWLGSKEVEQLALIHSFGRLIANTDMHKGNLSFIPQGNGKLQVAPVYDMLPMQYAPLAGGEIVPVRFEPQLPLPAARAVWLQACQAALNFWQLAAQDSRISAGFKTISQENFQTLSRLAQLA